MPTRKKYFSLWLLLPALLFTILPLHGQSADADLNSYSRAVRLFRAEEYRQALALFESIDDDYYRYRAIAKRAEIHKITNELPSFEAHYRQHVQRDSSQAENWYGLVQAVFQRGDYQQAISLTKSAIAAQRENIDLVGLVAFAFGRLGKTQQMIACFDSLLTLQPANEVYLYGLARGYSLAGEFAQAERCYDRVLALDSTATDALFWKLQTLEMQGRHQAFEQAGMQMYNRAHQHNDFETLSFVTHHLGMNSYGMGDYEAALKFYDESLRYSRTLNLTFAEGQTLGNMIGIFARLRDPRAIEYLPVAMQSAKASGRPDELQRFYNNAGVFYQTIGDGEQALDFYKKGVALANEMSEPHAGYLANLFFNIGEIEHGQQQFDSAIASMQRALQLAQAKGDAWTAAEFTMGLGKVFVDKKDYSTAKAHYDRAYEIFRSRADLPNFSHGDYWLSTGELQTKLGDFAAAQAAFEKALEIGTARQIASLIEQALLGLAEMEMRRANESTAIEYYKRAIHVSDSSGTALRAGELRASFQASSLHAYEKLVSIYAEKYRGTHDRVDLENALMYAGKAKARILLDLLSQGNLLQHLPAIDRKISKAWLATAHALDSKHRELQQSIANDDETVKATAGTKIDMLRSEITALHIKQQSLLDTIRQQLAGVLSETSSEITDLDAAQRLLRAPNQVILFYEVTEKQTWVWLIRQDDVRLQALPFGRKWLEARLHGISPALFARVQKNSKQKSTPAVHTHAWANINTDSLHTFYQHIFARPLEEHLHPGDELIIIADEVLHYLPFEMLVVEKAVTRPHYLIEKHPISYAASLAAIQATQTQQSRTDTSADKGALILANPDFANDESMPLLTYLREQVAAIFRDDELVPLPNSEKEAQAIADEIPHSAVYLGRDATEDVLKAQAARYRFIHLSTHNVIDDKHPMLSRLIFSQSASKEDGFFTLYEIFDAQWQAELVVLSACNTGAGELRRGEGLLSMAYAFRSAGVPSQVASLWWVEDATTSFLMQRFYRYLRRGLSKSRALQKAKIDVIRAAGKNLKKAAGNPYYWAPFILIGDATEVQFNE